MQFYFLEKMEIFIKQIDVELRLKLRHSIISFDPKKKEKIVIEN